MYKNVLSLQANRARKFFLEQENFVTINLPPYFDFKGVLSSLSSKLKGNSITKSELEAAKRVENVNHIIYDNKDGRYAWRKLRIINPYLYVSLVNLMTSQKSWEEICLRLKCLQEESIVECMSIPVVNIVGIRQRAAQISTWFTDIDQESIRMGLDYEYLFQTDITDCYGAIYTHTLAWALHTKTTAKANRKLGDLLGNGIDHHLQAASQGQTNGIPQGSVLMDLISEIVLAYIDHELSLRIKNDKSLKTSQFHILRYRDDYRIFTRRIHDGEVIIKILGVVLADMGMSLNAIKTKMSNRIILDSLKPDKRFLLNNPEPNYVRIDKGSLKKELYTIHMLSTEFPNSNQVTARLDKLDKRLAVALLQEDHLTNISMLINIAMESPNSFHLVASLISKMVSNIKTKEKKDILKRIFRKVRLVPNSGLLEIWLQRIAVTQGISHKYEERLCDLVEEKEAKIFDSTWISDKQIQLIINEAKIVDRKKLAALDPVISRREVELFLTKASRGY